jgi:hypothetical protein
MLKRNKKNGPVQLSGGLEAKRLEWWHVEALRELRPKQMFFANDTPDDLEPLRWAGWMLKQAGFTTTSHALRAFVLCGWPADTIAAATIRMQQAIDAGFLPMSMLYRDKAGHRNREWQKWSRQWARPSIAASKSEKL